MRKMGNCHFCNELAPLEEVLCPCGNSIGMLCSDCRRREERSPSLCSGCSEKERKMREAEERGRDDHDHAYDSWRDEEADMEYRASMKDAGRGHLLR